MNFVLRLILKLPFERETKNLGYNEKLNTQLIEKTFF